MKRQELGGIIHTYQKYDPQAFPSPTQPPPDMLSGAFDHLLAYGDLSELTEEELARAVKIDPRSIQGLGPSLQALMAMLRERKKKILEKYETKKVLEEARQNYRQTGEKIKPPRSLKDDFQRAFEEEQLRELERLWYRSGNDRSPFAQEMMPLVARLGEKYQIDELTAKYEFTGQTPLTVPQALEIKEELETIDRLLKQLEEASKNARIGLIDLDELAQFAEQQEIDNLSQLQRQVADYLRTLAEQQGLEKSGNQYQLTPKAFRTFQGKLLEQIFSHLQASRTGRHQGPIEGDGAVELAATRPYEFGDSLANLDLPATLINAMLRESGNVPSSLKQDDIVVHRTRNSPKCATVVAMDMSGSMRYGGQYINVKRMALALDGLISREYPGDYLQFVEIFTFAKPRRRNEIASLLPKPVTIYDPVVRLRADMSKSEISELQIPPHFTNLQHALQLSRQFLSTQDTTNRNLILITDGLPTAHFEGTQLFMLYPADKRTEEATLREGMLCAREGITINVFLLSSWSQTREDVRFAYRLAESTKGRVFFSGGRDLDRFVVWDYLSRKRRILG